MATATKSDPHTIPEALKWQADACAKLGSPLTGFLLQEARNDWEDGGIVREILPDWLGDPTADAMPLRLTGALHYAVLTGKAKALADFYPNVGGTFRRKGFWTAAASALQSNRHIVELFLAGSPQTNEVRRSAVLLGGFLTIAQQTGLPLRCFEIAASAGLNLHWEKFGYTISDENGATNTWGNADSPVQLESEWHGASAALKTNVRVMSRAGCDISPIDLGSEETRTRMTAFVWPDQIARFNNLRAAIDVALNNDIKLEKADAALWACAQLADDQKDVATVVYHSIAQNYFSKETMDGLTAAMEEAGSRATKAAPLAWLRMEFGHSMDDLPQLHLITWPSGEEKILADVHPHGNFVHWRPQ